MEGKMKVIHGDKGAGKTIRLLELSNRTGAIIVVFDGPCGHALFHESRKIGYKIPYPITMKEFVKGNYHSAEIKGFLFHNIDLCLKSLTDVKIDAITITTANDRLNSELGALSNE